jgi:predicted neuraminidase
MTLFKAPIFEQLSDRPFAHCATLTDLGDAGLMSIWMGGAYETAPNVCLLESRLRTGATEWTEPQVIAEVPGYSMGQPLMLVRPDGELWFFYVVILEDDWRSAVPYMKKSSDRGKTWSEPVLMFDYPGLMLRSRAHVLEKRIIIPAYDENTWQSRMIISDDDGASWRLTAPMISPNGNIHPNLVPLSDGRLLCYLRTGGKGGVIWRSESSDGGETWSALTETSLPNPNSGIDLLRLASGRMALAYNHSATLRTPLSVALTEGDNEIWCWSQVIEDEYAEISYPTLSQTADGLIHLVYTYKRESIHYARFDEAWLMQGQRP